MAEIKCRNRDLRMHVLKVIVNDPRLAGLSEHAFGELELTQNHKK